MYTDIVETWFGRFVLCLVLCCFILVFLSLFNIAITSLGEERANLSAFRTFVSICACLVLSILFSSWCLGRAADCDCGTLWIFLLPFFLIGNKQKWSICDRVICP